MGSIAADAPRAPDAEHMRRFANSLAALWPEFSADRELKLGLAVSGGPDSMALLLLAATAFPGQVEAATVDHGLRPESAGEARLVEQTCAALAVPHKTLVVDVADGNLQAQARTARYDALSGWMEARGLGGLATAHHADDQAETLVLRLNRASGLAGLAGVRAAGPVPGSAQVLLRPLLGWRRAELSAIVERSGIAAVQDPTNRDDRFDRVRVRKALADADWLNVDAIAQSAANLADADISLAWAAEREWITQVTREPPGMTYRPAAPKAIALRVIARILSEMDEPPPRGQALARVFDALSSGSPASIGDLVARPVPGGWHFTRAPQRRKPQA